MKTIETKFGFYQTTKETFLKLKELHKWYWKTLYAFHRWYRWDRKQPQNRHGEEPRFCSLFVTDKPWYRTTKTKDGYTRVKYFPMTVSDDGIIELYQKARRPLKEPVAVFSKETLDKINVLHGALELIKEEEAEKNQEKEVKIAS